MVGVIKNIFMSSTVSNVNGSSSSAFDFNPLAGKSKSLDQNDFLKLLVTQIQFQNPLNPKSDTDMAAQMAQFTALQQATQSSSSLQMMQASSLIGTNVQLDTDDLLKSGTVTGIKMENGKPKILVNGFEYNLNQILSVAAAPVLTTTNNTATN